MFHGGIPYNVQNLKWGIRLQQALHVPTSGIAHDALDQTEMIYQDIRKNAMQAYIKCKACYDKKANASKLKHADFVFVSQPKADHQEEKLFSTEFRWIGPFNIEKMVPNNLY